MSFRVSAKKKPTVLLAVLLIAHLGAVSLNRTANRSSPRYAQVWLSALLAPLQSATSTVGSAISGVWRHYFWLRDSRLENERLRAELAQQKEDLLKAREEAKFDQQLHALVNWQPAQSYQRVMAQIIARDANQWFNTVVIDRGTLSGISKDHPVVTADGLVGRVIEAAPNAARVLLLTDERHGAGAIIGQLTGSRVLGVVKGKNNYLCEMKFVDRETEKVELGETVITSGQDGLYPKGLVIGHVKRIETGSPTTPFVIEVEPAAPLTKLELVSVLLIPIEQRRTSISELSNLEKEKQGKPSDRKRR